MKKKQGLKVIPKFLARAIEGIHAQMGKMRRKQIGMADINFSFRLRLKCLLQPVKNSRRRWGSEIQTWKSLIYKCYLKPQTE